MLFNSVIFIMFFLPLSLLGWYLLQKMKKLLYAKVFLIGMSLWFYGYYNPWYLLILGVSLSVNYLCSFLFEHMKLKIQRNSILIIGLVVNLGLLFYFKYFNFFIDNCSFLFHTDLQLEKIALPLGISFFTFQQISFLVDRYKNEAPHYNVLDYSCFVTFFPQLIAGPIVLHSEFIPQLQERKNRTVDIAFFFDGFSLFSLGLAKKVLLADSLAIVVNHVFNEYAIIPYYLDAPSAWLTALCYMFQLYFDFSGYCDMARGIGRMFGFELPENFNAPYKATSIRDFWKRWHMTLTRFLTTYIYIPLGGNRKGNARHLLNLMIVFLVSGIWHGANWTFILWGVVNGIAIVFENIFPKVRFKNKVLQCFSTNVFVLLCWVIFRSDSVELALTFFRKMFTGGFTGYLFTMGKEFAVPEVYAVVKLFKWKFPQYLPFFGLICIALLIVISILLLRGSKAEIWIQKKAQTGLVLFLIGTLFTWSLISLSQVSTFLYFNF